MRTTQFLAWTTSALGGLLWLAGSSANAQHGHTQPADHPPQAAAPHEEKAPHEQKLKIGKTGEVQFMKDTIVGDVRLKPGRYTFQHRVDGEDHFVHFTELSNPRVGPGTVKAHPGEVRCRVQPIEKKSSATTLHLVEEGAAQRLTRVLIDGENVAHSF